ncbi:hypothetical protein ACVWYO_001438 [Sphingomonas sp. UYP23]
MKSRPMEVSGKRDRAATAHARAAVRDAKSRAVEWS